VSDDRQLVEAVRARLSIVDVVSKYVALREQGDNHVGRCPFHEEKSPSFAVSASKGVYHCFGCGAGGDLFSFVMAIEKLSFPEALEKLAAQAGLSVPRGRGEASPELKLRDLNDRVARFFERNLQTEAGSAARDYLAKRGLSPEVVARFRVGYALPGWQGLFNAFRRELKGLQALGLVLTSERGRRYDRFRDRLMFPLCDAQGGVLGFAGRQLNPDDKAPKYVNTPNTPLLKKGTLLYGLEQAQAAARAAGSLALVEGYTDVIAAHQAGVEHVVASMGTALTATQARLCARHASEVVLAFDQDAAGQGATLRGIQALLEEGVRVRMAALPAGSDPDSLIGERGAEAFRSVLDQARPFFQVYVDALCRQADVTRFEGKQRVLDDALAFLSGVTNLHWRGELIKALASTLDLPEEEIAAAVQRGRQPKRARPRPPEELPARRWGPEEHVVYFLLNGHLSVERATAELEEADFAQYRAIWDAVKAQHERRGTLQLELLHDALDTQGRKALTRLGVSELAFDDVHRAVEDALRKLKLTRVDRTLRALQEAQRDAEASGDHARAKELQARYVETFKSREVLIHGEGERTQHG